MLSLDRPHRFVLSPLICSFARSDTGRPLVMLFNRVLLRDIRSPFQETNKRVTLRRVKCGPKKKGIAQRSLVEPGQCLSYTRFKFLVRLWNQIAASFHPILALMKHESFEEEQEWRFVGSHGSPDCFPLKIGFEASVSSGIDWPELPISADSPKSRSQRHEGSRPWSAASG